MSEKSIEVQLEELKATLKWSISNWSRAIENMRIRKDNAEKEVDRLRPNARRYEWVRSDIHLELLLNETTNGEAFEFKQGKDLDDTIDLILSPLKAEESGEPQS